MQVHNLSGPIRIEGKDGKPAMPGDLLAIEILDLGALEGDEVGICLPMCHGPGPLILLARCMVACVLAVLVSVRLLSFAVAGTPSGTLPRVPVAGQMPGLF